MRTLISLFQGELDVSRGNAIFRVTTFLFLSLCCIATVIVAALVFPYTESFIEEVALLPGDHIQVQQVLDGEVLVGRTQFLEMAKGNTTFIAPGDRTIVYMTKVVGVSYRYNQTVHLDHNYFVSSQEIYNGILEREMSREIYTMIFLNIVFPLLILIVLAALIFAVQQGSDGFRWVWWG